MFRYMRLKSYCTEPLNLRTKEGIFKNQIESKPLEPFFFLNNFTNDSFLKNKSVLLKIDFNIFLEILVV